MKLTPRKMKPRMRQWIRHQWLHGREWLECHYCGAKLNFDAITLDHVKPRSKGGSNHISNLVPACHHCNSTRKNTDYGDFVRGIAA